MSRSTRLPIVKDSKPKGYYRQIRRSQNNSLRNQIQFEDLESVIIPNGNTIVNGYDVCDYKFFKWTSEFTRK